MLTLSDQGSKDSHTYTLTSLAATSVLQRTTTVLQRSDAAPITWDSTTETVKVYGSSGDDSWTVETPTPTHPVSFIGAGTTNKLVGPDQPGTTWDLQGADRGTLGLVTFDGMQNLVGGGSSNAFVFEHSGSVHGTIDGGSDKTNTLDYSHTHTALDVDLGRHLASLIHLGTDDGFSRIDSLVGSSGPGRLRGADTLNGWLITGAGKGKVNSFAFAHIGTLLGGSGVDTFLLENGASLSGKIDGGGGTNWLDYQGWTQAVTVNLATGSATGVANGVSRIRNVNLLASKGHDTLTGDSLGNILIGGAGITTLSGGSGRSVLVGGTGTATIVGGADDDILIAGTITFDANEAALTAVLAEWQRTDQSHAHRVAALSNSLIWGHTVLDNDAGAAQLTGGGGSDWFFANLGGTGIKDSITP